MQNVIKEEAIQKLGETIEVIDKENEIKDRKVSFSTENLGKHEKIG